MTFDVIDPSIDLKLYRLQLTQGGHAAADAVGALANLGAISKTQLDANSGVLALKAGNVADVAKFPTLPVTYKPTLSGDKVPAPGFAASVKITNYDMFTTYSLSASEGAVSRVGDTISYTPGTAGAKSLTVNGSVWPMNAVANAPKAPVVNFALAGYNDTASAGYFTTSSFSMRYGSDTHLNTDWQLSLDPNFGTIFDQSLADASRLVQWSYFALALNTTYYMRCRHRAAGGSVSDWSTPVTLTTSASYILDKETAKLLHTPRATNDHCGLRIGLSGDSTRFITGSVFENNYTGAAYVFLRTGTTWALEARIVPAAATAGAQVGYGVAIDQTGTRVAIGSPTATATGTATAGVVYIYTRAGTTWTLEATLIASDKIAAAQFGTYTSMSGDGTALAITAIAGTHNSVATAVAYVFTRSGTTWTQTTKLVPFDYDTNPTVSGGYPMAKISYAGTVVAFGVPSATVNYLANAGAVYVYMAASTPTSVWGRAAVLTATPFAENQFGRGIGLSGDGLRIAVGGILSAGDQGKVSVYTFANSVWALEATLQPAELLSFSGTTRSDMSFNYAGTRLIVGGSSANSNGSAAGGGAAWVFSRVGSTWTQDSRLTSSTPVAAANFGVSVSMSYVGDMVGIGAWQETVSGVSQCGASYIFT